MDSSHSVTRWIDLLETGDPDAANRLWDRYFVRLVQLARERLRDVPRRASDEEDVALSAFYAFCGAISDKRVAPLKDRDDLWRTLALIVVGKAIDERRRQFSQKRGGRGGVAVLELTHIEEVISRDPDPALAAQFAEELQSLLDALPDDELRQIALLKLEGYTREEIAANVNTSARTVARRLTLIRRSWEQATTTPSG